MNRKRQGDIRKIPSENQGDFSFNPLAPSYKERSERFKSGLLSIFYIT